jgi:hypothetical protein
MAPNLSASQRRQIWDMIVDGSLTSAQIAGAAGCRSRTIGLPVQTYAALAALMHPTMVADALDQ